MGVKKGKKAFSIEIRSFICLTVLTSLRVVVLLKKRRKRETEEERETERKKEK